MSLDVAFDEFETEVVLLLFTVKFVVFEFSFFILEEPWPFDEDTVDCEFVSAVTSFSTVWVSTADTSTFTFSATYSLISSSLYVVNESVVVPTDGSDVVVYSFTEVDESVFFSTPSTLVVVSVFTVSRTV